MKTQVTPEIIGLNAALNFIHERMIQPTKVRPVADAIVTIPTAQGLVDVALHDPEAICSECYGGRVTDENLWGEVIPCGHCQDTYVEPVEILGAYTAEPRLLDVILTDEEQELARETYAKQKEAK